MLLIAVALGCAYLACWQSTKTQGVADVLRHCCKRVGFSWEEADDEAAVDAFGPAFDISPAIPLVVGVTNQSVRNYYLWFFGHVAKIPYEQRLK